LKYILHVILLVFPLFCYSQTYFLLSESQKEYLEYKFFQRDIVDYPLIQPVSNKLLLDILSNDSSFHAESIRQIVTEPKTAIHIGTSFTGYLSNSNSGILANIYGIYKQDDYFAVFNYRADSDYQSNEKYFGSVGKFGANVIGRITDSFVQYNKGPFSAFYGRQGRNYGTLTNPSLILSDHPYSYDHFQFGYETKMVKYSYLTTRLEDKYAYDIRDETEGLDWHKRYLSFHHLNVNISKQLKIGVSESILYGGKDQSILPMYLNPLNIWFISKMVERKGIEESDANALLTLEILYKPSSKIILYSQFLIDDMDFTKETRERYPDRIGYLGKFIWVEPSLGSILSLDYTHISNWTYNSFYTFGNYTYYDEGLGYPKNGFEQLAIKYTNNYLKKVMVSSTIYLERAREQNLETHFVDMKTKFPIGTAQSTTGLSIKLSYLLSLKSSISIEGNWLDYRNFKHIQDNDNIFANLQISGSYRF
jgi:hypothetical protein